MLLRCLIIFLQQISYEQKRKLKININEIHLSNKTTFYAFYAF